MQGEVRSLLLPFEISVYKFLLSEIERWIRKTGQNRMKTDELELKWRITWKGLHMVGDKITVTSQLCNDLEQQVWCN